MTALCSVAIIRLPRLPFDHSLFADDFVFMPDSPTPAAGPQPDETSVAESPVASVWLRVSTSLLSVLHFAVLGTVFPMLPVYLRSTLKLSWTQTGIALAALPLGLIVAPLIERLARRTGLDARSGLAVSHLLAAGLAMTAAGGLAAQPDPSTAFWMARRSASVAPSLCIPTIGFLHAAIGRA